MLTSILLKTNLQCLYLVLHNLLNGEAFYFADPEVAHVSDDVKTAGKIALGAGLVAVAVVGVGFLLILTDDCSDCDE